MSETKPQEFKHVRPTAARQGQKVGRMRYVLLASLALAVIALALAWLQLF